MAHKRRYENPCFEGNAFFPIDAVKRVNMMTTIIVALFVSLPVFAGDADDTNQPGMLNSSQQTNDAFPYKKGDAVRIAVSSDTTHFVNGTYQIGDDGCVFLPVLGAIRIDTLSEKRFLTFLNTAYLSYLRFPTIQVRPLIRVSLLGGFEKPGLIYISPAASLWETVARAGGPIREDGMKKINWERGGKIIDKKLLPCIESGMSLKTVGVQSGDEFWITHVLKRERREIFMTDVLPVISVSISALAAAATLFVVFQTYQGTK
jgi:protein involved in polysaccharide export with SLBB domain